MKIVDDNRETDLDKLEKAKQVSTSVLQVKKSEKKVLDLRSPDDFKHWQKDPDDLRSERKAKRKMNPNQKGSQ